MTDLRVVVDARGEDGRLGGAQQGIRNIVRALSEVRVDDRIAPRYLTLEGHDGWVRASGADDSQIMRVPMPRLRSEARRLRTSRAGRALLRRGADIRARVRRPRASTGLFEQAGADVVIFPTQRAELTAVPFLYVPHDLQHRHLPELFSAPERRRREIEYGAYCRAASVVVAFTEWGAEDIAAAYGVDPARIVVIAPWAPSVPERAESVTGPEGSPYALFPAQAWPHKNHRRLFDALELLRADGLIVPVVCSGATGAGADALRRDLAARGLADQVSLPGYVDDAEMDRLRANARCLVFPTRFEGWGYPVLEAFERGVPVACSAGGFLDAVAGSAAVRFDPDDPAAIATALRSVWTDDAVRDDCVRRGRDHIAGFTWHAMSAAYADAIRLAARDRSGARV